MNKFRLSYKGISLFVKFCIFSIALIYLPYKIYTQYQSLSAANVKFHHPSLLILVFALMGLNWLIESFKWKLLVNSFQPFSYVQSIKGILAGISISLFMPNRTAEIAGRLKGIHPENKMRITMYSIWLNLAQLLVTIGFGIAAMLFLPYFSKASSGFMVPSVLPSQFTSFFEGSKWLLIIGLIAILFLYFRFPSLVNYFSHFKRWKWINTNLPSQLTLNNFLLTQILILSIIRYAVFTLQYYILLQYTGVFLSPLTGLCLIALIYFFVTIIPTFAFTELGVRVSIAVAIIGTVNNNTIGISLAALILWLINLGIPGLLGVLVWNPFPEFRRAFHLRYSKQITRK